MQLPFGSPAPNFDEALPELRKELKIFHGPPDLYGGPTYSIFDPISASYFQLSWEEGALLKNLKPGMSANQLSEALQKTTTLRVKPEEIMGFFEEAKKNGLLKQMKSAQELLEESKKLKIHPIKWLIHHYLYIRVSLFNPNSFLEKTLPYVRPFVSKSAWIFYFCISLNGIFTLFTRLDEYFSTFPHFFNAQGAISYMITIACTKILHEFAHAYTAKYYHVRVPSMGLAFLVLQPRLFTDVTDCWKLSNRYHRLAIDGAGILAELVLAGIATTVWAMCEPGIFQSIFFIISSVTILSTLLVNFNPAMRFDGYYLLSDFLAVDNLQQRAFAVTRWQLRKWFLGMHPPAPEEGIRIHLKTAMMLYSIYTWLYRIILYTGIVLFVYFEFTKILGIILALVEIVVFIIRPFWDELLQLIALRKYITMNKRSLTTLTFLLACLLWFTLPLPHTETFPAITATINEQTVYIPRDAFVEKMHVDRGNNVKKGQVLLELSSFPLDKEIQSTQVDIYTLEKEIHLFEQSEEQRSLIPEKEAQIASLQATLQGLKEQKKLLTIYADLSGTVSEWEMKPGRYVSQNHIVGKIAQLDAIKVFSFIPESQINDLKINDEVLFQSNGVLIQAKGRIRRISPVREENLKYPQLASIYGGDIPVSPESYDTLNMINSYYLVEIELNKVNPKLAVGVSGSIQWKSPWKSKLMELIEFLRSLYWKESGF